MVTATKKKPATKTKAKDKPPGKKPAKAKAPKPSSNGKHVPAAPEIPADLAIDGLMNIKEAEASWRNAQMEFEIKRSEAKAAKEAAATKLERLHEVVREETDQTPTLLSPKTRAAVRSANGDEGPPADDESWRSMTLKALSLPKGLLKKLAEARPPIVTVGDYCDYVKPDEKTGWIKRLNDIKGLGEAAITKLEDAVTNFFAERQRNQVVPLEGETTLVGDKAIVDEITVIACSLEDLLEAESDADAEAELDAEIDAAEPIGEKQ